MRTIRTACLGAIFAIACPVAHSQSAEDQLAQAVTALMQPAGSEGSYGDWSQIESVKQIRWEPLPPNMLDNALPDGSYFTRRGLANLGGRVLCFAAKGQRDPVGHVHFEDQQTQANRGDVLEVQQQQGGVEAVGRRRPGR